MNSSYLDSPAVPAESPMFLMTMRPQSPRFEYESCPRALSTVATHTVVLPTTCAASVVFQASRIASRGCIASCSV